MSVLSPQQLQNLNSTTTALVEESKATNQNIGSNTTQNNSVSPDELSFFKPNPKNYSFEGRAIGGSIGILASLGYAFKTKSGFWKGMGYWLIGSIAVGGLGYGVGTLIKKKKKNGEG